MIRVLDIVVWLLHAAFWLWHDNGPLCRWHDRQTLVFDQYGRATRKTPKCRWLCAVVLWSIHQYRNGPRRWQATYELWKKPSRCAFCGKLWPHVRQVPAPVPISDCYCNDCVEECRAYYARAVR